MEVAVKRWETVLQTGPGLQERLKRLDPQGLPATRKGDLLGIRIKGKTPLVVSWDGRNITVERREPQKPFFQWSMDEKKFNELFLGNCPPLLVAMNNDQAHIKAGADHHNGSLVVSFMVILQECMEGR